MRVRTNVVMFRLSTSDDIWHIGILVNAETEYATIVDIKGNVYRKVYSIIDYLDDGSFKI